MHIKSYLEEKATKLTNAEIANQLGISVAMISSYKNKNFNPSLTVAKKAYQMDGIVLHPFSEEAIKYEIEKDK
jgi:transcriptional regulator with XRE-family HTH domain